MPDDIEFDVAIGAEGVDAQRVMDAVREAVARKTAAGAYRDLRIARAERHNLHNLRDDAQFLRFYLECLQEAACVDINDFAIQERRRFGAGVWRAVKKLIWQSLKFYTYRLWSQQNQVNGLLATAIESLDAHYRTRLAALEQKLAAAATDATGGPQACRPPDA